MRIVVGFPAGGPTDIFARLMGQWLSQRLGQAFPVENRPGAGSTIGIASVVAAPADGYSLLLISTSAVISASYYKNLSFNITRDIAPVCGISLEPLVMVVNPSVPAKTVPEFIAYAKANPGKIVMASVGNGTTPHLAGEEFKLMAKVDLLHVPYQGAAPALTDLFGGRADVMFEAMPTLVGYIKSGKLRALAVGTKTRSPVMPELPAVAEFLPGYEGDRLVRHRRRQEDADRHRRTPQQGDQRRPQRSHAARADRRGRRPAADRLDRRLRKTLCRRCAEVG